MTATNHAVTGALIGLAIGNPAIAVPVAFASHFALDAIPHYDPPGDELIRIRSKRFKNELILHTLLCLLLVVCLAITRPQHWITAAFSAFAAAAPDLFWIPKFLAANKKNRLPFSQSLFWRFHSWIQWRTGPDLWWAEALWFVVFGGLLAASL